jgi:hypothetical protein
MKLLILDTRRGNPQADLFIADEQDLQFRKLQLGGVPEIHYDEANHQLVVVETELGKNDQRRFWLKCFSADSFELKFQLETPLRPMYSGYPGRSTRVKSSPSGRFLYFQEQTTHPTSIEIYRLLIHRYDSQTGNTELGTLKIDSCLLDFDIFGEDENELAFHLSCEFPSVIAFGTFKAEELEYLPLETITSRTHTLQETCGSWFSRKKKRLFCITGEGVIYDIRSNPPQVRLITRLKISKGSFIPLQQICECGEFLLVGISININERGMSLASQIWQVSIQTGEITKKIKLPFPIRNFVTTPDNQIIIGISPYQKALILIETKSGSILGIKEQIGLTPAEVLVIP